MMTSNTINNAVTIAGGAAGTLLAGRYRVVRQLGVGGMGSVWLAEDTQLDNKPFAIKMLPQVVASDKEADNSVKREAKVAMKLSHSNIVVLRDYVENGGNPFLLMDYVEGMPLSSCLADWGRLSPEETIALLAPVAAAIDYAHTQGVIHRDIKPGNIIVRAKDVTPFVLDFGIARDVHESMSRMTGKQSSGTLMYMSPEQINGELPAKAHDIYSFAATVYQCLAGKPPFSRGDITHQILNNPPPPLPPGCSGRLGAAVMAGLDKNPAKRPLSCTNLLRGIIPGDKKLRRLLNNMLPRPSKKRILPFFITGVLVSLIAGGVYYGSSKQWKTSDGNAVLKHGDTKTTTLPGGATTEMIYVAPKHGDTKTITLPGGATMEMIYVAPGDYVFGDDNSPKKMNHGFWLGKYEVTQEQWQSVMGSNPSCFKGKKRPVENVSYYDCHDFIKKVNAKLKCGARLPTPYEWEYACRAGTATRYSWGQSSNGTQSNCQGVWPAWSEKGPYLGRTTDVGSYEAKGTNHWGFCDMHGNVWEWCEGGGRGYMEQRGGGWECPAWMCRSAHRHWFKAHKRKYNNGFRLCCSALP